MKTFLHQSHFLSIVFLIANLFFASGVFAQATVSTDLLDYPPGATAYITGSGFQAGETVTLLVEHVGDDPLGTDEEYHQPWTIVADSIGNIATSWYVPTDGDALGATFLLTADGQSGAHAEWTFTDAISLTPFKIGSQSGTLTGGTAGSVTYSVDIKVTGSNTAIPITLSIPYLSTVDGLPAGVTYTPTSVSYSNGSYTFMLTLTTTSATPNGTYTFVVSASGTDVTTATHTGTLTIGACTQPNNTSAGFTGNTICAGETGILTFDALDSSFNPPYTIVYTNGTTQWSQTISSGSATPFNVAVNPIVTTTYTLVSITNGIGCVRTTGFGDATAQIMVKALPIAPIAMNYSGIYDGVSHTGSATPGSGETIDWYTASSGGSITTAPLGTNAGAYTAYAEARNTTTGCVSATRTLVTVAIAKKVASVVVDANQTKVYGSADLPFTGVASGFIPADGVTATYTRVTGETVGSYAISATLAPAGVLANYTITNTPANFTITKKDASVVVDANQTKVYGSANLPCTGVLSGFIPADGVTPTYTRVTGETVGTYAISATLAPAGVLANYTITNTPANFTITKKDASVVVDANQTKAYGSADLPFTGVASGFIPADGVTATYTRVTGETVGSYAISATLAPAGVLANYTITNTPANFTITKKDASVVVDANQTKVYGSANLPCTGVLSGFIPADGVTPTYTRVTGETVGTYAISATLAPAGVLTNYTITNTPANFTITKKDASVVVDANQTKVYGSADLPFTGVVSGFIPADGVTATYTRVTGETVGTYAISATLAPAGVLANYTIINTPANFTITKKTVTVTPTSAQTKAYGEDNPVYAYGFAPALIGTDSFSGALSREGLEDVGNYNITQGDLALSTNYTMAFTPAMKFTITKANLTVTVNTGQTKVYGASDPTLTYTITGFVNGDDEADLDTAVAITRATGEHVGNYTITPAAAVDANYIVGFVTAQFAITKADLTVVNTSRSKVYGVALTNVDYAGSFTGVTAGDNITLTRASVGDASNASVGDYAIVGTLLDPNNRLGNYEVSNPNGVLTVTKASITVVNTSRSKVYGVVLANADYAGSITGVTAGDNITVTRASVGAVATASVRDYAIIGTLADPDSRLGNYEVSNPNGVLTVTKASITVVNTSRSKVYGVVLANADYAGSITGVTAGDNITLTRASVGGVATASLGDYAIIGTLADPDSRSGNYEVSNPNGVLTVTKASITVVNTSRSKVYGVVLANADYAGSITGVTAGDNITVTRASVGGVATATVANSPYAIIGTLVDPDNRLANYELSNPNGVLTVTKASITVVNTDRSKVYGVVLANADYAGSITAVATGDNITVTRASVGGVANATVAGSPYAIIGTLVDPDNRLANYEVSNPNGVLTVTKARITVVNTSRSKVYGVALTNADYARSITGIQAGDNITITRASLGDAANATVAGSTYPIVGTLVDPDNRLGNYEVSNPNGVLTVTKASITVVNTDRSKVYGVVLANADYAGSITGVTAGDNITATRASVGGVATATVANSPYAIIGTLVDPDNRLANYEVSNPNGVLTVTKASITVVNTDRSKVYGVVLANADYAGSITAVAAGDNITVTRASVGGVANATVAGSQYAIIGTLVDPDNRLANYEVLNPNGVLTVTKASITVVNTSRSKVYGVVIANADYAGSITGVTAGDNITLTRASVGGVATASVGDYAIIGTLADPDSRLGNYEVSNPNGVLTVTQKAATVVAVAKSKIYGEANPTLTETVSGTVNGDVLNYYLATAANATSGFGTYPIAVTLVLNPNYSVTKTDAVLTVTQKAATVVAVAKSKIYGEANPTLTETVSGTMNGDVLNYSLATAANATSGVGTYPIAVTLGLNPNYSVTKTDTVLTVSQKAATVVAVAKSKIYGEPNPTLTETVSGTMNGDVLNYSLATAANATSGVGTYPIAVTLGLNPNYSVTKTDAVLTVSKCPITIAADSNQSKYIGQIDPTWTYNITSGNLVGSDVFTGLLSRDLGECAGTYAIQRNTVSLSNNYDLTYVCKDLTIKLLTVDASASSAPVSVSNAQLTLSAIISPPVQNVWVTFTIDNGNAVNPIVATYSVQTDSFGLATKTITNLPVEVYKITATIGNANSPVCVKSILSVAYLAVYDPNGGFVTGGGWINSPAEAYTANRTLTGKANFGFVSKYKKGSNVPEGNTEFQFQAGNLNFTSSTYVTGSLVVAGSQAIYKGIGTINGSGSYNFMVSAVDGQINGGGGYDKFRIKIWNSADVIYDNNKGVSDNGTPTDATKLGGGSIVIHEVNKNIGKILEIDKKPLEALQFNVIAYPNPSAQYFNIEMKGGSTEKVDVMVYDVLGRTIKHIESNDSQFISFGEELPAGSYIAIVSQGINQKTVRLIKQ